MLLEKQFVAALWDEVVEDDFLVVGETVTRSEVLVTVNDRLFCV